MNVVIVDDEVLSVENIEKSLRAYEAFVIQATFTEPMEALAYLIRTPCDLLFLDIEMPGMSGLYIAEQVALLHAKTRICFISAHEEGAIKAFELNALDYITKPFSKERFHKCIARYLYENGETGAAGENKKARMHALWDVNQTIDYSLDMVCGYREEDIVIIRSSEIYYFETNCSVVYIHTKRAVYRGNKPLAFYEKKLRTHCFFQTHKSYLVNLAKVDYFRPRITYTYDMFFKDIEDVVPVSRTKVKELKQYFN